MFGWNARFSLALLLSLLACRSDRNAAEPLPKTPTRVLAAGWTKNLLLDDVPYDVYMPKQLRGAILVLPGWDFPRDGWIKNTDLTKRAEEKGYALVLPEMLKTLYESSYFPETRMKWNAVPGGKFIKDRLLPEMDSRHGLLRTGGRNFLLGLSTGGRGVALVALENPGRFTAGASISGDFLQERIPADRLMQAVYGSYELFPERWVGKDNPAKRAAEWKLPLYLAHGSADNIVPPEQTKLFFDALKAKAPNVRVEYKVIPGGAHDYKVWGGELPGVFEFFESL